MKKIFLLIMVVGMFVITAGYFVGGIYVNKKQNITSSDMSNMSYSEKLEMSNRTSKEVFEESTIEQTVEETKNRSETLPDFNLINEYNKLNSGGTYDIASSDTYDNMLMINRKKKQMFQAKNGKNFVTSSFYNRANIVENVFINSSVYADVVNIDDLSNDIALTNVDFTEYDKYLIYRTSDNNYYILITQNNGELTVDLLKNGSFFSNESIKNKGSSPVATIITHNFKKALETRDITKAYNDTQEESKPLFEVVYDDGVGYGFVNRDVSVNHTYVFYNISDDEHVIKLTAAAITLIDSLYFD